jgi:uncharacterized tellurite resistance protein B-like protein
MITIEESTSLRLEEKDAILDAVLGMAWTDGEVQPGELQLLKKLACHLTERDPAALLAEYTPDLERVGRKIARSDLGPTGRKVLVRAMAYMAAASGNVTEAERVFYQQCLLAFGTPERERAKIEKQVRQMIYAEFVRKRLAGKGDVIDATERAELDERKRTLDLDDESASKIEAEVLREMA